MSTALVTPGQITDAADATDLLDQLVAANITRVEDTLDARTRIEQRKQAEKEIRNRYRAKAKDYYAKLWSRCGESAVGHNYVNLDVGDKTISVCDTCSFAKGKINKRGYGYHDESTEDRAQEYMQDLATNLSKQLMELDEQAGLLEWPKDDDFIGQEQKFGQKKRRFF